MNDVVMVWVAWLTGLPGSGKSSVAREAAARLKASGLRVRVLELDEIRRVVTPSPRYTSEEREVVVPRPGLYGTAAL